MIESPVSLPRLLKARGRAMPKRKYQRPEVYATGKREKLWKGEWREYYLDAEGKEQSRHKSKTWSRANYTKSEAQEALDELLREKKQAGPPKRDGSMMLAAFWDEVYYPVHAGKWGVSSRRLISSIWRKHIEPALGAMALKDIGKTDIDLHLLALAEAGLGKDGVAGVLKWLRSALTEAVDGDYIPKNPARKVKVPACKPKPETRSLDEDEVRRLWDTAQGVDYVVWRLLVLTGLRIGELLALDRTDLLPTGLLISKSALDGHASTTKNKKARLVPLSPDLRAELEDWLRTHNHSLVFPAPRGGLYWRNSEKLEEMLERARKLAKIPSLTFKQCRTTFATLVDADVADAQAMLGHHSPAVTLEFYKKAIPTRQQEAVDRLESKLKVVPINRGVA
jgi:integrase